MQIEIQQDVRINTESKIVTVGKYLNFSCGRYFQCIVSMQYDDIRFYNSVIHITKNNTSTSIYTDEIENIDIITHC